MLYVRAAAQVTPRMLEMAEDIYDGWFADAAQIDWDDFLDRLASVAQFEPEPFDFDQIDNPAVRKIKRHIKKIREM